MNEVAEIWARIGRDLPTNTGDSRTLPYICPNRRAPKMAGQKVHKRWSKTKIGKCPQQDSNLRTRLRRAVLYPLSYGGSATVKE